MFYKYLCVLVFVFSFVDGSPVFRYDYSYARGAGGWLKLHRVPAIWNDALLLCHAEGAVLASPLTRHFQNEMIELATSSSVHTIFTGVHSVFSKGVYTSVEGVPISRLHVTWAQGEPDNYEDTESCLVMQAAFNGTMGDVKCTDVFPFICYKKKTQNLIISGCGTHDKEYIYNAETGSCYKFHRSGLPWHGAYRTCVAEGGHLIIINSEVEARALKEIYAKNPDNTIFAKFPYASIGIYLNSGDAGYWMTLHGQTPTEAGYDKWQSGEPNNGTQPRGEFCGVTHRNNGLLHDAPCDWVMPFICEKKPINAINEEDISIASD